MKTVYNAINDRLNDVDFAQIIKGFERCSFAIFGDEKAVIDGEMIDKPTQFVANSYAQYNDALVATFYHDFLPNEIDLASALIVHEMFHAFQFGKMDYRALLANNSEKNGVFYDYSAEAMTLKYNEVACLIEAYLNESEAAYQRFLSFRQLRQNRYPKEVQYENATEFIEGFATYVELKVLEQLDEKLFVKKVTEMIESLGNIEFYFSIRELSYAVGALMLLTMDKLKMNYDRVLQGESFIVDAYPFQYIEPEVKNRSDIDSLVSQKSMENQAAVAQFFSESHCKITFDEVVGYNPMCIRRSGDKLLVKYLVFIKEGGVERPLNGDFCLVCDDNHDVVELYKSGDLNG